MPFPPSALSALANVDLALEQGAALPLFKVLQSPALGLRGLQPQNSDWYLKQLQSDRQQKRQVTASWVEPAGVSVHLFESCAIVEWYLWGLFFLVELFLLRIN